MFRDEEKVKKRQTFVFSATLAFVHEQPAWLKLKKGQKGQLTEAQKLGMINSLTFIGWVKLEAGIYLVFTYGKHMVMISLITL